LLDAGRAHERAGRLDDAASAFEGAAREAQSRGAAGILSESLRLLAVVHHRRQMEEQANDLCQRAYDVALQIDDARRTAEALNTMGTFALERGQLDQARQRYERALELAKNAPALRARIRQNLGIIANIRGEFDTALAHYAEALAGYLAAGDEGGSAAVYHNLGMINADRGLFDQADQCFRKAMQLATSIDDQHYRALCLINHCEVFLARRDFRAAKRQAETAIAILDDIGQPRHKADAYKVLGIVYRETNRPQLAEARLQDAIRMAVESGSVLLQAEASRELALLARSLGRAQETLNALNDAHRLFRQVDARVDLVDVSARVDDLEDVYLTVVREWGESIESADAYTHGHCERVAEYSLSVSDTLGLDETERTTIRVGAYLHDVGKVRVPHEILNKPGRLTEAEFATMQRHPVDGIEMLKGVEFPWNITPIIRWHHEKNDGTGYPDGLSGMAIPLHAQIVCVADVFDALTSTRSYRGAMPIERALEVMVESRDWWRPSVFDAFMTAQGCGRLARGTTGEC